MSTTTKLRNYFKRYILFNVLFMCFNFLVAVSIIIVEKEILINVTEEINLKNQYFENGKYFIKVNNREITYEINNTDIKIIDLKIVNFIRFIVVLDILIYFGYTYVMYIKYKAEIKVIDDEVSNLILYTSTKCDVEFKTNEFVDIKKFIMDFTKNIESETKSRLSKILTHEFKTPLQVLKGLINLMQIRSDITYAKRIDDELQYLDSVVMTVLNNESVFVFEFFNLKNALITVAKNYLKCAYTFEMDSKVQIRCNYNNFVEMLIILFDNINKYSSSNLYVKFSDNLLMFKNEKNNIKSGTNIGMQMMEFLCKINLIKLDVTNDLEYITKLKIDSENVKND